MRGTPDAKLDQWSLEFVEIYPEYVELIVGER